MVAISLLSTRFTACQSESAYMITRSSTYAHFLETVVGRSEMKMLKRRGALWPGPLAISVGMGETAITNHFHGHVDHVCIRKQLQQLAGGATMPNSVVGFEIDKHSFGVFLSQIAVLDVLCQQGDLVYGRPAVSGAYQRRAQFPTRLITSGGAEWLQQAPKSSNNLRSTLFKTVHLLPKGLRFEYGAAKLAAWATCPLTSLRPCPCRKPACSFWSIGSMIGLHERKWVSRGSKGTHSRDTGRQLFGSPSGSSGFGDRNYQCSPPNLWNLWIGACRK